jgi:hypothetical protein
LGKLATEGLTIVLGQVKAQPSCCVAWGATAWIIIGEQGDPIITSAINRTQIYTQLAIHKVAASGYDGYHNSRHDATH